MASLRDHGYGENRIRNKDYKKKDRASMLMEFLFVYIGAISEIKLHFSLQYIVSFLKNTRESCTVQRFCQVLSQNFLRGVFGVCFRLIMTEDEERETMISFKGAHFPQDIILMGVRWYVTYPLSADRKFKQP
jgi:hypothetical protein